MTEGREIIWLNSTDSTNDECRRRFSSLDNLSIIAARSQTCGRGQGGHVWTSADGENLTFSLAIKYGVPGLPVRELQTINDYITGVLTTLLREENVEAWVKKPNDIWVGDRKICGILIENVLHGEFASASIVGIGLNINQTLWPGFLPNPVSLKQLTGKEYPPELVLERISDLCKKNWSIYFKRSEAL